MNMNTFSEENQERIKLLAREVRLKHGAMLWGVSPKDLIKCEGLKYDEYDLGEKGFLTYINKTLKTFKKVAAKIKAALIVLEKYILVDRDLHYAKKPFGQAHELAHHTISEHKEILYACSEHDLHPKVRKEMEFEANVFASETLYPTPLLKTIHEEYPVSMETILHLRELAQGSFHSAAIKYVQTSDKKCCLQILKEEYNDDSRGLRLKEQIFSKPWWGCYGQLLADDQFFSEEHILSRVVFSGDAEDVVKGEIHVENTEKKFQVHTFYNKFIVLALLFN